MSEAHDTIAAIATATGGGIGVLRVSGPDALSIAHTLLGRTPVPRHAHYLVLRDGQHRAIDRGLLIAYFAPASFTGEDVVELHAHGNAILLEAVLGRICELGARRALPGEFTERAFLNGKLDLTQAEAVADIIAAGSERQLRAAMRSLEGAFSHEVHTLLDALTTLRAHIEAAIDFTDEDIDFLEDPVLATRLEHCRALLDALLAAARRGRQLRDGLYVVITGAPNVGKSSLLNALARAERAIVSAMPGTTRDVLRETVTLGGARIELADTAGLRETLDPVEAEGVRRAASERARADLVVEVRDACAPSDSHAAASDVQATQSTVPQSAVHSKAADETRQATNSLHPVENDQIDTSKPRPPRGRGWGEGRVCVNRIIVHNKIDLAELEPRVEHHEHGAEVWLCAHDGRGVGLLEVLLAEAAGGGEEAHGTFSARARHVDALARTQTHILSAVEQLREGVGELAAEELRQAQNALGEITGTFTPDDLLAKIFSTFCIGK